ncbi:MAG: aminotransferase class V-fold PLP-dependent enzyme, partial [Actinomycetota bacterium]
YQALADRMEALSRKNSVKTGFLGDGLQVYRTHEIVGHVCSIRNLTTSYTPYQPERSQGTLITHWIYQSTLAQLTGFEAVNSSLYDRASALFEAAVCAVRMADAEANTVLVAGTLLPADLEVLRTHVADTSVKLEFLAPEDATGRLSAAGIAAAAARLGKQLAAVIFPQVNALGLLEDVDALTDACADAGVKSVAVIDPMLLATGGRKAPAKYGRKGADILVGEGQHLAIGANFGGPGLGLFAVRHHADKKNEVRETPGRFVGKAKDNAGRDCIVMVMSTREQHIRKDKATSNICSNQAFIATIAGAAILARGEAGMAASCVAGRDQARRAAAKLHNIPGLKVCYADQAFWNEFSLMLPEPAAAVIAKGRAAGLHVGVDSTGRVDPDQLLDAVRPDTALVHLQWGNHEVGTLQPVAPVVAACRERGVLVHVDAAQAAGRVPLGLRELGADLVSVSGHKLGGPTGTGVLAVRRGLRIPPLLVGGDQERARRAGLEHTAGIVGLGAAAAELTRTLPAVEARCRALTDRVRAWAAGAEGVEVLGAPADGSLPHLVCLGLAGVEPQPMLLGLDALGISVHSGSSCSSESLEPSPVLEAMGVDAQRSLRVSVSWANDDEDVERFTSAATRVLGELRALRP